MQYAANAWQRHKFYMKEYGKNIRAPSQYKDSLSMYNYIRYKDVTVVTVLSRPYYSYNGNSYTDNMASLHWNPHISTIVKSCTSNVYSLALFPLT